MKNKPSRYDKLCLIWAQQGAIEAEHREKETKQIKLEMGIQRIKDACDRVKYFYKGARRSF